MMQLPQSLHSSSSILFNHCKNEEKPVLARKHILKITMTIVGLMAMGKVCFCDSALPGQSGEKAPQVTSGVEMPAGLSPFEVFLRESPPTESRQQLCLSEAAKRTLADSPVLRSQSWELQALEASLLQAGLLPNPEMEVEFENFGGTEGSRGTDALETTVALAQTLEIGGKRSRRVRLAASELELEAQEFASLQLDVLASVLEQYTDAWAAQERVELLERFLNISRRVAKTVDQKVEQGKVSPLERTNANIAVQRVKAKLDNSMVERDNLFRSLALHWAETEPGFVSVAALPTVVVPLPPLNVMVSKARTNPDLTRWEMVKKQRQAASNLETAAARPDLTFSVGVRDSREGDNHALVAGLSLPIPLFDRNQGARERSLVRLRQWEDEYKAAELEIQAELEDTYALCQSAYKKAQTYREEILPAARKAHDGTKDGYSMGKFSYLEMLDSQRALLEVEEEYLNARKDFYEHSASLYRLTCGTEVLEIYATKNQGE